jgi:hypothetical protein
LGLLSSPTASEEGGAKREASDHLASSLALPTFYFSDPLLKQQLEEESVCRCLPIIEEMMRGKRLITTKSAWDRVCKMLRVVWLFVYFVLRCFDVF